MASPAPAPRASKTLQSAGIVAPSAPSRVPLIVGVIVLVLGAGALASAIFAFRATEPRVGSAETEDDDRSTKRKKPRAKDDEPAPRAPAAPPSPPPTLPAAASPCGRDLQGMGAALARIFGDDTRYMQIHVMPTMAIVMVSRASEPKLLGVYQYDFGSQQVTRTTGSALRGVETFFDLRTISWGVVGGLCADAETRYRALAGSPGQPMSLMITSASGQVPPHVVINVESPALSKAFCWDVRGKTIDC